MGDLDTRQRQGRQKALDKLLRNKMSILLKMVDELGAMGLSALQIEIVFEACGLDYDYAVRFGSLMAVTSEIDYEELDLFDR